MNTKIVPLMLLSEDDLHLLLQQHVFPPQGEISCSTAYQIHAALSASSKEKKEALFTIFIFAHFPGSHMNPTFATICANEC